MQAQANSDNSKTPSVPDKLQIPLLERAAVTPQEFGALFGRGKGWAYKRVYAGLVKKIDGIPEIMIPISEVKRLMGRTVTHTGVS